MIFSFWTYSYIPFLVSLFMWVSTIQLGLQTLLRFGTLKMYSTAVCLQVPVFSLTDILRYKPVVVLEGACLSLTWIPLMWGEVIVQMRLMQIAFDFVSAAEVAYYSYLYAIVNERNYRRVTSYDRSADFTWTLLACSLAHVPISTGAATYLTLNQV
ncbi:unnamed protein product [Angiostrongylus costaricensis]|uniref:Very-long-chain (3R)-3-hydroxyacyl-CoA dehydratase n=1 Tax=Angiostrongylus costaricensis TaxID=334426 RepID=A0A0R3Q219_ANGCS|nr:unnamed protein product [Angiostrongylus costaricensis]